MSECKCIPAPETVAEATCRAAEGITSSEPIAEECEAAYQKYENENAMNEADNALADSGNGNEDFENDSQNAADENAYLKDKRGSLAPSNEAEIKRAAEEARRRDSQAGMIELTQRGVALAEIAGFIADRVTVNTGRTHDRVRVEGEDAIGNRYQLELSIVSSSVLNDPTTGI